MSSISNNQAVVLSIIIPTFNEAGCVDQTLDALEKITEAVEVIVVDGGSSDETVRIVRKHKVKVIASARGRGAQMHAGAGAAQGNVLWFLHADTVPSPDAVEQIANSLSDSRLVGGTCNVYFGGDRFSARFLTWFYRQVRRLGLCYGDSAIFVRRDAYEQTGGFKPFPIFEDLDLVRRLRKCGRMAHLPARVVTSSRRFEGRSFALTFARWAFLQVLYWTRINPQTLGRLYAPIRNPKP